VDRSSGKIPKSIFFGTTDRISNEFVSKKPALWIALPAKSPRAYFLAQQTGFQMSLCQKSRRCGSLFWQNPQERIFWHNRSQFQIKKECFPCHFHRSEQLLNIPFVFILKSSNLKRIFKKTYFIFPICARAY